MAMDTEHLYTFTEAEVNAGVYDLHPTWLPNTAPTRIRNQYHQHRVLADGVQRALMFTNQHVNYIGNAVGTGSSPVLTNFSTAINILEAPTYRKYSWHQQPDNTTWGRQITVAVPADNADDTAVQTARDGGYDLFTGDGFSTETSIEDPMDTIVEATNFNNAAAALAHYALNGTRTGSDLHIGSKALTYTGLDDTGVINALNDRVLLLHDFTGSRIDFTGSLTFDGVNAQPSGIITSRTGTHTFGIGTAGILPDSFITGVQADSGILFMGPPSCSKPR